MIQASRTFRIFVSSTFDDLKEERNALQKHVFPKLRELCLQHGCRFQAIDLRWGVSEEAAIDQQTMKICFEEIGRCQRVTPRPNFIVLLGDRYGWCPLPYEIPALEFEEIKTNIKDNESIELLNKWYQCDYNAVPPVYDLQPRKREYVESANWEPIERRLRSILLEAVKTMDLSEEAQSKYWASATEQEIRCGALKVDKASEHVFCFFRTIKNIPHDPSAKKYIDLDETGNIDSDARRKLVALKCCLKEKLPNNIFKYEAQWTKSAVSSDHLNQLCDDALRSLTQVIEREIAGLEETNPLDEEIDAHEAFGKERISAFTGREDILTAISDYIKGPSIYPYVIRGESGSGKTALMAKTVERVREGCPEAKVFCRYIGATPESSDGRSLLERLCNQIYNTFDFENQKQRKLAEIKKDDEDAKQRRQEVEREYEIPMDFQKLSPIFRSFLSKIPSQEKLILFIDALDQLSDTDHARNLTWLPSELPRNIRVIVSTLPGKCLSLLERMLPEKNLKELEPMPLAEGTDLLKSWLKAAGRTLQNNQMKEVLGKFTKSGLPFYLKLAFEEARRWKSYTPRVDLSPDIPGIIRDFFKRLSLPANHGKVLVSHSMGYLAAAKNGLTEDELLDILSLDKTVFKYFADRAHHEPTETKLPVVVWLRLYHELESYLTERTADGTIVLSFYHRQLLEVVDDIFFEDGVKQKRHSLLASYFDKQPLWQEGQGKRTPNVRKVSELPYQQTYGELWDAIEKTLCDLHFVEAKCIGGLTHQLLSDFSLVFDVLPEAQIENEERKRYQKRIKKYIKNLKAYSESAIDNLKIISSLQPWNEEIIREEIDKIIKYPSRLNRIKAFHKFVNSHSQFLINFSYLDGFCVQQAYNIANSGPVAEAAQKIIESKNVKSKMILCNELSRHPYTPLPAMLNVYKSKFGICSGIAISAYSKTALIAFSDRINGNGLLYMWDITTGEILQQFESDCINCVAMTIDGRIGISGGGQDQFSYNGEAIIWDLLEGKPLTVLEDDNLYDDDGDEFLYAKITSVALSWDGRYAAIGRNNGFLSVFDLKNNKCFSLLQDDGIYEPIILTITANGQVIAIQDGYKLSMWDIKSKNHLGNIERVSADLEVGGVTSLAATPEGKFLVTGHENGTITVWNLITKKRIQEIIHCGCSVISVDITHDGELVASGGEDSKVKIWSMITGNCLCDLVGHTDVVTSVALSVDGKYVISGSRDSTFRMWDIENGQINTLRNNTHTYQALNNVVISPNAKMVAFSSPSMDAPKITYDAHGNYIYVETQINVFHMNEQNKMFSIEDLNKGVSAIKFTPDSMKIIFWEKDYGDLHISDVEKGQINRDFYESGNISSISISPDGKRVIVCAQDVDVFDVNTGHELHTFQRGWWKEWRPAKISLDGRLAFVPALVVGKDRYSVLKQDNLPLAVIDIENGNILNLFSRLDENIYGLEVMPDNDHILLGDDRGYIQLWSLWEDKCQKTFKAHEGTVCSIKASPDGNYIISSDHEVVHFWNLLSGKCVKKINLNSSDFPVVSDFDKKVKISADGRYVLILQERRISIFNLKKGDCIATLAPPDGITAFDLKNELIVCNQGGDIVSYHFKNFEPIIPVATPVRMWQFEKQGKTIAIGDWEDRITVDCKWCGQRFPVEDETLEMIKCIVRETSIDKQKKSCNSKLDKTRKLLNCSNCKQYLQFSPFIVDNSEKDYLSGSKIRKYCSHIYEHFRLSFKRSFNKYGKWLNRWFEIDRIHHYYFKSGFEFVAKKEDDLLPSIEDVQEAYDDEYRNSYYEICKHVNEITKQISLITISWLMSSVGIALFLIKDSIYEKIIAGSIYGFVLVYPVACFQAWRFFRQGLTGPQGIVVVFMKMLIYGSIYEKIIARLIYTFVVFVLNYHTACIQAWKNFRQGLKGTKEIAIKFMGFLAAHFVLIGLILIFSFIERFWIFLIGSGFSLGYYVIFAKALIVGILAPFIIISSGVLSALNHRHIFWRNLAKILWTRIIVKCRFRGRSKLQVPIYMIPLLFYILSPAIISGVTLAFFELIFFALSIQYLIHSRINK